MAQINTWTAVSALGLGANLQHHAPIFMKEEINAMYGVAEWLEGCMPSWSLGAKRESRERRSYMSDENRFVAKGFVVGVTGQRQMNGNHLCLANKSDEVQMRDLIACKHRS